MKINCILGFLFLSNSSAVETNLRTNLAKQRGLQNNDKERTICKAIPQNMYKGLSTLINVDNSTPGYLPTTGDVSIANALTPGKNIDFPSIKAICTLTDADPSLSPPFCTLETTLGDGKIMSMGSPPDLVVMGGTGAYSRASGTMTTARDFTRDGDTISFTALIDYCIPIDGSPNPAPTPTPPGPTPSRPTSTCENDNKWRTLLTNGKTRNCNYVNNDPGVRCALFGKDNVVADAACLKSCGCPA